MNDPHDLDLLGRSFSRRRLITSGAAGAGLLLLPSCGESAGGPTFAGRPRADIVLKAQRATIDLAGRTAATWTYDGRLPGREIRLRQGRKVRIRLDNDLPEATTIHWHGIRLANAMDGVPGLTQSAVRPGDSFLYEFTPPDAGTYVFHPHVGVQFDRGLYGPLIVEARDEPLRYDDEAVLVLDDWLDGLAGTPIGRLAELRRKGMAMAGGMAGDDKSGTSGMGGMDMGGSSTTTTTTTKPGTGMGGMEMGGTGPGAGSGAMTMNGLAMRGADRGHTTLAGAAPPAGHLAGLANDMEANRVDVGDVAYPLHLVNGQPAKDPFVKRVKKGDRVRMRLINIAGDTIYCFFVEGHELTVTHADGQPVEPVTTDALLVGMGERYDVLIDAKAGGSSRILAFPVGKRDGAAVGVLRYADARGSADLRAPVTMPRRIASYSDLRDAEAFDAPAAPSLRRADLAMDMSKRYGWTIGGKAGLGAPAITAAKGEAVRLAMRNMSNMPHPMHLHGHFFRPVLEGRLGPRKDTILVPPMTEVAVDLVADNPGKWAFHCHNAYHADAGMERTFQVA
ncbi:MAG: multicopper oxidase family protein [Actinobacteria bacterium]|nr:multicopper oxidase family protein [Actinomycetota bacterium]